MVSLKSKVSPKALSAIATASSKIYFSIESIAEYDMSHT
jgi:hypothetical protein